MSLKVSSVSYPSSLDYHHQAIVVPNTKKEGQTGTLTYSARWQPSLAARNAQITMLSTSSQLTSLQYNL